MGKGTHFLGQPILNQLLNYFNKQKNNPHTYACEGLERVALTEFAEK